MTLLSKILIASVLISAMTFSIDSQAAAKNICGHSINYTPSRASSDVPANISAFLGFWAGEVAMSGTTGVCLIFVVESVDAAGNAVVTHAWGDPNIATFGVRRFGNDRITGRISNGVLTFQIKSTYRLAISPSNPEVITGEIIFASHGGKGTFSVNRIEKF